MLKNLLSKLLIFGLLVLSLARMGFGEESHWASADDSLALEASQGSELCQSDDGPSDNSCADLPFDHCLRCHQTHCFASVELRQDDRQIIVYSSYLVPSHYRSPLSQDLAHRLFRPPRLS